MVILESSSGLYPTEVSLCITCGWFYTAWASVHFLTVVFFLNFYVGLLESEIVCKKHWTGVKAVSALLKGVMVEPLHWTILLLTFFVVFKFFHWLLSFINICTFNNMVFITLWLLVWLSLHCLDLLMRWYQFLPVGCAAEQVKCWNVHAAFNDIWSQIYVFSGIIILQQLQTATRVFKWYLMLE